MIVARMDLPMDFDSCPDAWRNFVRSLDDELRTESNGFTTEVLDKELAAYSGRFIKDTAVHSIIGFESEEGFLLFTLKFGNTR